MNSDKNTPWLLGSAFLLVIDWQNPQFSFHVEDDRDYESDINQYF